MIELFKKVVNTENNTETIEPLTSAEITDFNKRKKEHEAFLEAEAAKDAARQALLDKLGITADEAKLLLG